MALHLDGARISNAAAALGVPLRAFTTDAGVDVLSFGGTKNGAAARRGDRGAQPRGVSEGLIVPAQAEHAARLEDALRLARSSSRCSRATCGCATPRTPTRWRPACARRSRPRSPPARSRRAVHPADPGERGVRDAARRRAPTACAKRFRFYDWNPATGEVRWMCAFDTTEADVDAFVAAIISEVRVN